MATTNDYYIVVTNSMTISDYETGSINLLSQLATHFVLSETVANARFCVSSCDRTRGLWPQCKSAGSLRERNITVVLVVGKASLAAKSRSSKGQPG